MLMGNTTNKNKVDDLWSPCWMCPMFQLRRMWYKLELWQWHPQNITSLTNNLSDSYSLSKTNYKETQTQLCTVMAVYSCCCVGVYHGSWRWKSCTGCRNEIAERARERDFAWSCIQVLNMFLDLDKIRKIAGEDASVGWWKMGTWRLPLINSL